jgi:hypothetical protein
MVNFLPFTEFVWSSGWWIEASPVSFSSRRGMESLKKAWSPSRVAELNVFLTDPDPTFPQILDPNFKDQNFYQKRKKSSLSF